LSHDRDIAKNRNKEEVPIKQILNAVARHLGCEVASITKARRGRGDKNHP
jgi:hypothetical protein